MADRFKSGIVALAIVLLAGSAARACPPCPEIWNLRRTVVEAELIVVAERTEVPGGEARAVARGDGPPFIDLRVLRVLKGEARAPTLRVASWYGMCEYGLYVGEGRWLVFLAHRQSIEQVPPAPERERIAYVSLNGGCAKKALRLRGEAVEVDGDYLSLDEFRTRYLAPPAAESRQ